MSLICICWMISTALVVDGIWRFRDLFVTPDPRPAESRTGSRSEIETPREGNHVVDQTRR